DGIRDATVTGVQTCALPIWTHLPAAGLRPAAARRLLGPDRLIGASAHSADEAARAETDGADFIVLGPIFTTPSKRAFGPPIGLGDRKSTRLNSSHGSSSYAV